MFIFLEKQDLNTLVNQCSDCEEFSLCDFANFAAFFAGAKALGSGCSESIRKQAMLAYSLGMALKIELSASSGGSTPVLGTLAMCQILRKMHDIILKCCAHPDYHRVINTGTDPNKHAVPEYLKNQLDRQKQRKEELNKRSGLTARSDNTVQENLTINRNFVAMCSSVDAVIPGVNLLGHKVTGIKQLGATRIINRDNCLQAGKIWNTTDNSCYCVDEKVTDHMLVGDTKIEQKQFSLVPPSDFSNIVGLEPMNLDPGDHERFVAILSEKEDVTLTDLQKTEEALNYGCQWFTYLRDGKQFYFLGSRENKNTPIKACYLEYNFYTSPVLSSGDKKNRLDQKELANKNCCHKCYSHGCECERQNSGKCICTGTSNSGMPCHTITKVRPSSSDSPILRTSGFNSDDHIIREKARAITCCNQQMNCPAGMTDLDCCEQLCMEDSINMIVTNPRLHKNITKIRVNRPYANIGSDTCCHNDACCRCTADDPKRRGKTISWPCCCHSAIASKSSCCETASTTLGTSVNRIDPLNNNY